MTALAFLFLTAYGQNRGTTGQQGQQGQPAQTKSADLTDFTMIPFASQRPNMVLPTSSRSADLTVFPPMGGIQGGFVPQQSPALGYQVNPLTGQYQPIPLAVSAPGGNPPGCGTYRNCLACQRASWYGCGWNAGNQNGPIGCSQTFQPSQCTGFPGPTETLAPCEAYLDCASCTNQAGCVFLAQSGSCIYSAGPACLQDPTRCVNYPAQCPVNSPYTLPSYNPFSVVKQPYSASSGVYIPGFNPGSSFPMGLNPFVGGFNGVNPTGPLFGGSLPGPTSPFPSGPSSPFPGTYVPTYTGFGQAAPYGTLGALNSFNSPFMSGMGMGGMAPAYLNRQLMPYTTTQYITVTTISSTPGPNSIPLNLPGMMGPYARSVDTSQSQSQSQSQQTMQGVPNQQQFQMPNPQQFQAPMPNQQQFQTFPYQNPQNPQQVYQPGQQVYQPFP